MTTTHQQNKMNPRWLLGLALLPLLASGCTIEQATAHHRQVGLGMASTAAPGGWEVTETVVARVPAPPAVVVVDNLPWGLASTATPVDHAERAFPVIAGAHPAPPGPAVVVALPGVMPSGLTATAAPTGTPEEQRLAAAEEIERERQQSRPVSSQSVAGAAQHDAETEP